VAKLVFLVCYLNVCWRALDVTLTLTLSLTLTLTPTLTLLTLTMHILTFGQKLLPPVATTEEKWSASALQWWRRIHRSSRLQERKDGL